MTRKSQTPKGKYDAPEWSGTLAPPYDPVPVTDLDIAFPAQVRHLMPPMSVIPAPFQEEPRQTKWGRFVSDMFYRGLAEMQFQRKPGIDADTAWRHYRCILGTFETKHEHKEAASAWLLSLWFEDVEWKPREAKTP